ELAQYVPPTRPRSGHLGFAVPLQLRSSRGDLCLMTTIMSFATAVDVTIAELKLEAFLPADAHTASVLLAQHSPARSSGTTAGRPPAPRGPRRSHLLPAMSATTATRP